MSTNSRSLQSSVEKLSSGERVNRASDDAAASSMISKMNAKVRGHQQTERNIQNGLSVLQTADQGLAEIYESVKRLQTLMTQAGNGTVGAEGKLAIQNEINEVIASIDQVANVTEYNGANILAAQGGPDYDKIIEGLKSSWLEKAEDLIQQEYGLTADGADLKIEVHTLDGQSGVLAYVSGYPGADGKYYNQELHIDLDDFTPGDLPNGGTGPNYNDRIIAHEMVHAVMGRTMNFASLPTWFKEGTAEFIHGADERVTGDLAAAGGNAQTIVDQLDGGWGSGSIDYSAGYAATKYLHSNIGGNGIKDIMTFLSTNNGSTLDTALANEGTYADTATFLADFKVNGANYINNTMNLGDADTGSIGGSDHGGASLDAASVVPDINNLTDDPMTGFVEDWPDGSQSFVIQVGLYNDTESVFELGTYLPDARASSLGLANVDVINNIGDAFDKLELSITALNSHRTKIGGAMNALSVAYSNAQTQRINMNASRATIRDTNMANETASMTRHQILVEATTAMIAQANQSKSTLLSLIQNVGT